MADSDYGEVDERMAEYMSWESEEAMRPESVREAERMRRESETADLSPAENGTDIDRPALAPVAPLPEWPTLLRVLLARLRGEQPFECCYFCLTSDDPRNLCAEHHHRLAVIVNYEGAGRAVELLQAIAPVCHLCSARLDAIASEAA